MDISFVKRSDKDKVDSREVHSLIKVKLSHTRWLKTVVLPHKDLIEKETAEILELEDIPSKRGKPAKIAWFTVTQLLFCISLQGNTTKEAIELKAKISREYAYVLHQRKSAGNETTMMTTVWQDRLDKILVTTLHDSKAGEVELCKKEWIKNRFSPDEKFIQFLSKLEAETGYILPWDFDFDSCGIQTYPRQYKKYIDIYRELTETDDARILSMWGKDEELPSLPDEEYLVPDNAVPQVGGVWLDEPPACKIYWREFIQCVREVVEAYNDPKRKEKYGIPSPHELETDYEDLKEDTTFLKKTLKAYNRFTRLYDVKHKVLGFQVHKDWLEWLKSADKMAETMRQFYLGFTSEVYFYLEKCEDEDGDEYYKASRGSFVVVYPLWADIKDGKTWSQLPFDHPSHFGDEPPRSPDAPLFRRVRIYDEKYEPIFDWYLENIWLPQQGLKFFQATDPKGYPQLALLLKDLPSKTALPKRFVQSVQKQLAGSTR